jgi:hypothetical protein
MALDNDTIEQIIQGLADRIKGESKKATVKGATEKAEAAESAAEKGDLSKTTEQLQLQAEARERSARATLQNIKLAAQENELMFEKHKAAEQWSELEKSLIDLQDQLAKAINKENKEEEKRIRALIAEYQPLIDKNRRAIDGFNQLTEAQKKMKKQSDDLWDSIAAKMGFNTKVQDTYAGKTIKFLNVWSESGVKDGAKLFFGSIAKGILNLPLQILDSLVKMTIEQIFAMDKASASFNAATGFAGKYDKQIHELGQSHLELGIFAEDAKKAFMDMSSKMGDFSIMSEAAQKKAGILVASLEKIGVAGEDTASIMDFFTKVGGMTGDQVLETTRELVTMGAAIGVTASKMGKDFMTAMPKLAVYGNRAHEIFGKIAAAAKKSSTSVSGLLELAGKFDTFSSAAETAGKLNAILGSQMSATEMLQMTEEQRIETLIMNVQASGMAFRDMDRFTQKAIAAAAGITDMNEASKIFSMNLGGYHQYQSEMATSQKGQEELNEAIKKGQPIMMRLKIAFMKMLPALEPLVEKVRWIVENFEEWTDSIKDQVLEWAAWYGGIRIGLAVFPGLIGAMVNWNRFRKINNALTGASTSGLKKNAKMGKKWQKGMKAQTKLTAAQGQASKAAGLKMLGLAAVLLAIGVSVWLVADGIVAITNAFKGLTGKQLGMASAGLAIFALMLVLVGKGILVLATASLAGGWALAALALVILAVGAGVWLAATAMATLVDSLSGVSTNGLKAIAILAGAAVALWLLAPALGITSGGIIAVGTAAMGAAPGLGVFIAVVGVLGLVLSLLAHKMAEMFKQMAAFASAIKGTASDTKALATAMWDLAWAATKMGNPLALLGTYSMIKLAKEYKGAAVALSEGMKSIGEGFGDISTLLPSLSEISGLGDVMDELAEGMRKLDASMGKGKKRVEIVSTLEHLATIATAGAGQSMSSATAGVKAASVSAKSELKAIFKDLIVKIGDKEIKAIVDERFFKLEAGRTA